MSNIPVLYPRNQAEGHHKHGRESGLVSATVEEQPNTGTVNIKQDLTVEYIPFSSLEFPRMRGYRVLDTPKGSSCGTPNQLSVRNLPLPLGSHFVAKHESNTYILPVVKYARRSGTY